MNYHAIIMATILAGMASCTSQSSTSSEDVVDPPASDLTLMTNASETITEEWSVMAQGQSTTGCIYVTRPAGVPPHPGVKIIYRESGDGATEREESIRTLAEGNKIYTDGFPTVFDNNWQPSIPSTSRHFIVERGC